MSLLLFYLIDLEANFEIMTAELILSPEENREKEIDFMLGTYDKDKRIAKLATPVSDKIIKLIIKTNCILLFIVFVKNQSYLEINRLP